MASQELSNLLKGLAGKGMVDVMCLQLLHDQLMIAKGRNATRVAIPKK